VLEVEEGAAVRYAGKERGDLGFARGGRLELEQRVTHDGGDEDAVACNEAMTM
jgi:hypothetical protein